MAPMRILKAYYETEEGQVHYRYLKATIRDASKSPIVLLHMSATSSAYYEDLILKYVSEGYDCYAPDMPGFGNSYDPQYQPAGIKYYVDAFMPLAEHVGISQFHLFGHHSGASIATEMAVLHPDKVITLCISSPATMPREAQIKFEKEQLTAYNKPVREGTHWSKSWDFINAHYTWTLDQLQGLTLDATRAWQGRIQIYTCVFTQPMIELLSQVKCPVLGLGSTEGVLYEYMDNIKKAKPDATLAIVQGGDFEVMRDVEGVCKEWIKFVAK